MLNHNHRFTIFPSVSLSTHCCKRHCMNIFISFKIIKQQKKKIQPITFPHSHHTRAIPQRPCPLSLVLCCVALFYCVHCCVALTASCRFVPAFTNWKFCGVALLLSSWLALSSTAIQRTRPNTIEIILEGRADTVEKNKNIFYFARKTRKVL